MAKKYLGTIGLSHFINKIKALLAKKADTDLSNVENSVFLDKASSAGAGGIPIVEAITEDGRVYNATAPGITELKEGTLIVVIANESNSNYPVKLNINSLGEKEVKRFVLPDNNGQTYSAVFKNKEFERALPHILYFHWDSWYSIQYVVTNLSNNSNVSGILEIPNGGTGSMSADGARANLNVPKKDLTDVAHLDFKRKIYNTGTLPAIAAESTDGITYTATIEGITSIPYGVVINLAPKRDSNSTSPLFKINSGHSASIKFMVSDDMTARVNATKNDWMKAGSYIPIMYDGTYWVVLNAKPGATDISGTIPISKGGTGATTAAAALTALGAAASGHTHNYLPLAGGTLTGDLRIKSGNFGRKLRLGDGEYVYIYEPTDDFLEIKGSKGIALDGTITSTTPTTLKTNEVKFVYS